MIAKYKVNGFYYSVDKIENGIIYLIFNGQPVPVRISDVEDIC